MKTNMTPTRTARKAKRMRRTRLTITSEFGPRAALGPVGLAVRSVGSVKVTDMLNDLLRNEYGFILTEFGDWRKVWEVGSVVVAHARLAAVRGILDVLAVEGAVLVALREAVEGVVDEVPRAALAQVDLAVVVADLGRVAAVKKRDVSGFAVWRNEKRNGKNLRDGVVAEVVLFLLAVAGVAGEAGEVPHAPELLGEVFLVPAEMAGVLLVHFPQFFLHSDVGDPGLGVRVSGASIGQ